MASSGAKRRRNLSRRLAANSATVRRRSWLRSIAFITCATAWLDRALKAGVDALTAAILMGHRDPSTIAKVYQHLAQSPDYLRNAAKKAAAG